MKQPAGEWDGSNRSRGPSCFSKQVDRPHPPARGRPILCRGSAAAMALRRSACSSGWAPRPTARTGPAGVRKNKTSREPSCKGNRRTEYLILFTMTIHGSTSLHTYGARDALSASCVLGPSPSHNLHLRLDHSTSAFRLPKQPPMPPCPHETHRPPYAAQRLPCPPGPHLQRQPHARRLAQPLGVQQRALAGHHRRRVPAILQAHHLA